MMNLYNPQLKLLKDFTGMFYIDGCTHCRKYFEFIGELMSKLNPKVKFEFINCTYYHDYGIVDDQRIPIFIKYYDGSYPTVFIKGEVIKGANSVEELKARILPYFTDKFIIDEDLETDVEGNTYEWLFNKRCKFIKKGFFRRKIECQ